MFDMIKSTVDTSLDEHAHKIRTELLWIRGKYEEKLEVRGTSSTVVMRNHCGLTGRMRRSVLLVRRRVGCPRPVRCARRSCQTTPCLTRRGRRTTVGAPPSSSSA